MIYTASYFQPKNHHGKLISISITAPRWFVVHDKIPFFAPSLQLLQQWQRSPDEAKYTAMFREEIRANLPVIKRWVDIQPIHDDMTLLCWEKAGEFCHRNLVGKLIAKYRPEIFGGADVPN